MVGEKGMVSPFVSKLQDGSGTAITYHSLNCHRSPVPCGGLRFLEPHDALWQRPSL